MWIIGMASNYQVDFSSLKKERKKLSNFKLSNLECVEKQREKEVEKTFKFSKTIFDCKSLNDRQFLASSNSKQD